MFLQASDWPKQHGAKLISGGGQTDFQPGLLLSNAEGIRIYQTYILENVSAPEICDNLHTGLDI